MEVRPDGRRRSTGRCCDLLEGEFIEISKAHGLAVVGRQVRDRITKPGRPLVPLERDGWIIRCRACAGRRHAVRIDREDRARTTLEGSVARLPDGDAHQPATQRSVAAEGRQTAIGGDEGFLGGVLRVGRVGEDPSTDGQDDGRFAIDEHTKGIPVPAEDGIDQRSVLVASPLVRLRSPRGSIPDRTADMASVLSAG